MTTEYREVFASQSINQASLSDVLMLCIRQRSKFKRILGKYIG